MQVAILAGSDCLGGYGEKSLRSGARLEELTIGNAIGNDLNPLDVMLFLHGMRHAPHQNINASCNKFDYRYMLLFGGIDSILGPECHFLAATYQSCTTAMDNLHDVAAQFTFVDF